MLFTKIFLFVLASSPRVDDEIPRILTLNTVVQRVLLVSPRLQAEAESVAEMNAYTKSAGVYLPSNPTVSASLGWRTNDDGAKAFNITGTLSQQVEIGGQRRKRIRVAQENVKSQKDQLRITKQKVISDALLAFYDVLALQEETKILENVYENSKGLVQVSQSLENVGLGTPLTAELTKTRSSVILERLILAKGRTQIAEARLSSALALDPTDPLPKILGPLRPLPQPTEDLEQLLVTVQKRPELTLAIAMQQTEKAKLLLMKRERIPTPSLSLFGQKDGFNERVFGFGIAVPIPLPAPVGHTNKGNIEAAQARIRSTRKMHAHIKQSVELQLVTAFWEYEARKQARSAYDKAALEQAEKSLSSLTEQVHAGRLTMKDALTIQQTLYEFLLSALKSQHQLCRSSVALHLAAGFPFDGDKP